MGILRSYIASFLRVSREVEFLLKKLIPWISLEMGAIRSSIEELRWAHNPKVGGSKPPFVTETIVEWSIIPGNGPGDVGSNPTGLTFF